MIKTVGEICLIVLGIYLWYLGSKRSKPLHGDLMDRQIQAITRSPFNAMAIFLWMIAVILIFS